MSQMIQAVRGMNDILPPETFLWQHAENIFRRVLQSYGFQEIRFPIVEKTELFKRSIGEITDIVEKEMYTFADRNDENLTLRPEGTACCVRASLEHGLLYNQIQHLWYTGPYFRYERPQKGRTRQFHQCAAEVFGIEGPEADAELIILSASILEKLGLTAQVKLQINSLGTVECRIKYRQLLVDYLKQHISHLDEDSLRRLEKNPLRILDSKNPELHDIISLAPKLLDCLDDESRNHFEKLKYYLQQTGIPFEVNPCLVRGLDYYTRTVFEWVTENLGAQGTVCAGGRYDGLVEQLGGKATPALGFAFGLERIILLIEKNTQQQISLHPHAYLITENRACFTQGLKLANDLRMKLPNLRLILHTQSTSMKNQFKKADKSGAQIALIIGEQERQSQTVALKHLREDTHQQSLQQNELTDYLDRLVASLCSDVPT